MPSRIEQRPQDRHRVFVLALLGTMVCPVGATAQAVYKETLEGPTATPVTPPFVNLFGVLLEREKLPVGDIGPLTCSPASGCVREVTFRFENAPAPRTSGLLIVTAGGDIGFRAGEAHTDYISVIGGDGEKIRADVSSGIELGRLYENFATGCPPGEQRGKLANGKLCGVNYHNIQGPLPNGDDAIPSNDVDHYARASLVISKADLAALIDKGTLPITLYPNSSDGTTGVGRVKYRSVVLIYNTPEPATLALLGAGIAGMLGAGWARGRRGPNAS